MYQNCCPNCCPYDCPYRGWYPYYPYPMPYCPPNPGIWFGSSTTQNGINTTGTSCVNEDNKNKDK
jgi:hypothetical protein